MATIRAHRAWVDETQSYIKGDLTLTIVESWYDYETGQHWKCLAEGGRFVFLSESDVIK